MAQPGPKTTVSMKGSVQNGYKDSNSPINGTRSDKRRQTGYTFNSKVPSVRDELATLKEEINQSGNLRKLSQNPEMKVPSNSFQLHGLIDVKPKQLHAAGNERKSPPRGRKQSDKFENGVKIRVNENRRVTQVKDNEGEDEQENQIVVNDNMIERYRGKSENKVSVLDANENGHYNSKTLTN